MNSNASADEYIVSDLVGSHRGVGESYRAMTQYSGPGIRGSRRPSALHWPIPPWRSNPSFLQNPNKATREPAKPTHDDRPRKPNRETGENPATESHGAHGRAISRGRSPGRLRAADHLRAGVACAADVCGEEGGVACA